MKNQKGALVLVKEFFFPHQTLAEARAELNALTAEDRVQLGTAIAANQGLSQEDCSFQFVQY